MKYCIQRTSLQIVVTIFWKSNSMYFSIDDRIWGLSSVQIPNRIYFQPNHNQNKTQGSFSNLKKKIQTIAATNDLNGFSIPWKSIQDFVQVSSIQNSITTITNRVLHTYTKYCMLKESVQRQRQNRGNGNKNTNSNSTIAIAFQFKYTTVSIWLSLELKLKQLFLAVTLLTTHSLTLAVYTNAHRTLSSSALE